jgi:gliding motility-associated peptidyl-prolyl isomerase
MRPYPFLIVFSILLACGGPEPRKPVEVRSGGFIKESVARNRELLAREESRIKEIITQDSLHNYLSTASGSWYYYNHKIDAATYTPRAGDLVTIRFNILSLDNDTIYSEEEIGDLEYLVDKEDKDVLFPGLRNSVKILKETETATFLFPSSLAYGYPGDKGRIGTNVPIKSTITLLQIEKQQDSIQN